MTNFLTSPSWKQHHPAPNNGWTPVAFKWPVMCEKPLLYSRASSNGASYWPVAARCLHLGQPHGTGFDISITTRYWIGVSGSANKQYIFLIILMVKQNKSVWIRTIHQFDDIKAIVQWGGGTKQQPAKQSLVKTQCTSVDKGAWCPSILAQ